MTDRRACLADLLFHVGGPESCILSFMTRLCRRLTTTLAVVTLSLVALRAAEQTWVGEISDSACAMKHESGVENVPPPPANECVANCIRGGSKYVIVAGDKVLQIVNQNAAGLADLAGSKVKITGELKGDAVAISKIEKAQ
jgi:hypothetical protein